MINLSKVNYKYKNGFKALNDINLSIEPGEVTVIVGKNGSGKSTLGNVIAKIFDIKTGNITIDGEDASKMTNLDIRRKIGIVFQNPDNQIIFNRVYDDIMFTLKNLKLEENADEIINRSLSAVGMSEYINHNPYELSLGQKSRIAVANALSINPSYIVFDEATAMLDELGKKEIYKIVRSLKDSGIGVILITNIMEEILLGDRIVILESGNIKDVILSESLFSKLASFTNSGLSIPFKVKLIDELNKKNKVKDYSEESLINIVGNL